MHMACKNALLLWWNSGKLTVEILCSAHAETYTYLFAVITEMRPLFPFISPSLNPKPEEFVKNCCYLLGNVPAYPGGCPQKQLQRSWNLMRLLFLMVWH